jgi:hypothetical protein
MVRTAPWERKSVSALLRGAIPKTADFQSRGNSTRELCDLRKNQAEKYAKDENEQAPT